VPALQRLRLSSLDSMEVDSDLLDVLTQETRVLPHVHLSLQAGSNVILGSMKRRHSREQAIELCQTLKSQRPEIVLGADFIAGFPGETDDMFDETVQLVQACDLTYLHVFPFSKRPGTPASRMPDQIPADIIKARAAQLRQVGQRALQQALQRKVGSTMRVLAENTRCGHSDDFTDVHFASPVPGLGVWDVEIIAAHENYVVGQVVSPMVSAAIV
jgi:threonylcarbamoyladenosine tRNA methylthiotransferase MtaB